MDMNEGVAAEVELMPTDDKQRDAIMQDNIQLMLRTAKLMVSGIAHELRIEAPAASSVVMSVLATTTMLYVRGYPREAHGVHFKELAGYFARLAMEEEAKESINDNANG